MVYEFLAQAKENDSLFMYKMKKFSLSKKIGLKITNEK